MAARYMWVMISPPPDYQTGRVIVTEIRDGETNAQICVRTALAAYPDVPIFTLMIAGDEIAPGVLVPESIIDKVLEGIDLIDARRILIDQIATEQKPN